MHNALRRTHFIGFITRKSAIREPGTAKSEKIGDSGVLRTRTLNSRKAVPRRVSSSSRSRSAPCRVCARENIILYAKASRAKREPTSRNPGHIPLQDAYFTLKGLNAYKSTGYLSPPCPTAGPVAPPAPPPRTIKSRPKVRAHRAG